MTAPMTIGSVPAHAERGAAASVLALQRFEHEQRRQS